MLPYTKESYKLLHDASIALAEVEANGLCIDEGYLEKAIRTTERKIDAIKSRLIHSDVGVRWRERYRNNMNLHSNIQLANVLFREDDETVARTDKGRVKVDEKTLSTIDNPFIKDFLKMKKLDKALNTYLMGLKREIVDGKIHPMFNLHIARTFRSSAEAPNFQNIPIRDPKIGKLIRSAFIPRRGNHIAELDYSGIEVKIAACYHKDPTMMEYLLDDTKDMHRDMAMECFMLSSQDMGKLKKLADAKHKKMGKMYGKIRYCGKNMFVFPQFYGDWYIDCARALWDAIDSMKLTTADGTSLKAHLMSKGITELGALNPLDKPVRGTFEDHINRVERNFWEKRFPVYNQWKQSWFDQYKEKGWFLTKTGFICQGFMKKNEVVNYPVQGPAFHCLLWSLTQMVRKEMKKAKMKTLIVGQIHDSIVADSPHGELDEFLHLAREVMVDKLMKHWKWIITPLDIEAEVAPMDQSWATKEKYVIVA